MIAGLAATRYLPATIDHWSLADEMLCSKRQVDCMAFAVVRGRNFTDIDLRVLNQADEASLGNKGMSIEKFLTRLRETKLATSKA